MALVVECSDSEATGEHWRELVLSVAELAHLAGAPLTLTLGDGSTYVGIVQTWDRMRGDGGVQLRRYYPGVDGSFGEVAVLEPPTWFLVTEVRELQWLGPK
ncbi:hypothetical protein SEA_VANLEE_141 [Gordonia phage VanLee]|uniref:Uncharacterized protein n=1 Tax=Gordonia phage VanLee TaxID=2845816 RepID=A0A8F2D9L3_9CAUD|nr:hypothetical protein QEH49_gp149 [Gordonia phage VanLee]QWS68257.1 hypothetical protein SEA_VANLEE_141 [Gordonia phage VanLee]